MSKNRIKKRNLGKQTSQQRTAQYNAEYRGNQQCVCGALKKFRKCCGDPIKARDFSDKWERDEVRRYQRWQEEGQVSGLPPQPIMQYAERWGIVLNAEHQADKDRRAEERRANLPSHRAIMATMAAVGGWAD